MSQIIYLMMIIIHLKKIMYCMKINVDIFLGLIFIITSVKILPVRDFKAKPWDRSELKVVSSKYSKCSIS